MPADDWENEPIATQPKPRILARPAPANASASDANPRYDSAFPALGGVGAPGQQGTEGDDDWFRGPQQNNRQLWDTANRSTPPTVVSPTAEAGPPPRMQILKRPSDAPKSRSTTPQNRPQKSLTQREEEYRLARERIFGAGEGSGSGAASPSSQPGSNARDPQQQREPSSGPANHGQRDQREQGNYQRDFRETNSQREQSRESSNSGRRRGNITPRSGRTSPDELSRDMAGLSMRGGKAPGGPAPVLRGGMSPGVLRQPRGPSGAGFGRTEPEVEEKKEPARGEYTRSTSDFSRSGAAGQPPNEYSRATPGDYSRNTNDYSRGDSYRPPPNEYSRSAPPQVSRSSSYSSSTSHSSYGFAGQFDQTRGYIGAIGGPPTGVPPVGAGYQAAPYQPAPYAPYSPQPGGFQQQQPFQQPGYYARPAYAGQQLYGGYSPAPGAPGPGAPPKNGAGFERAAYPPQPQQQYGGGGSYGVPGGPPGPPPQQQGRPPQGGQAFYRPSPGAYGQ